MPKKPNKKTSQESGNAEKNQSLDVKQAILKLSKNDSEANKDALMRALNGSTFHSLILTDEIKFGDMDDQGNTTLLPGSKVKIVTVRDPQGRTYLPLFTDWEEIKKYMVDSKVPYLSTMLSARAAWDIILRGNYVGTIINPADKPLPLVKKQVHYLMAHMPPLKETAKKAVSGDTKMPIKATAKKAPSKKETSKKVAAKKTATKKTAGKKTAGKKTAAKKAAPKKVASKKVASKKAAAKKTAAKKAAARKKPTS